MAENEPKYAPVWLQRIRDFVLVIIGIATTVTAFYTNYVNNKIDTQTRIIEQTIKKKEFENEIRFRIYEEVKKAIANPKDTAFQKVVYIMVEQLLEEDTLFLEKMKSVFIASAGVDSTIKNKILQSDLFDNQEKENQQMKIAAMQSNPGKDTTSRIIVDVFYLTDIEAEALPKAEMIVAEINKTYGNKYLARLRVLPSAVNARSGYRIDANQIRFEKEEEQYAGEIRELVVSRKILPLEQPFLKVVRNNTPRYISVFIRNY